MFQPVCLVLVQGKRISGNKEITLLLNAMGVLQKHNHREALKPFKNHSWVHKRLFPIPEEVQLPLHGHKAAQDATTK